ncbi:MAG: HAMP domain-containing histidine kinase [Clostridia bacterium]|nr:HAMP domain-containing histidine kinase [Clostridia bacterium]
MKKSVTLRGVLLALLIASLPVCLVGLIVLDRATAVWVQPVDGSVTVRANASKPLAIEADWVRAYEDPATGEAVVSAFLYLDVEEPQQLALVVRSSHELVAVNANGRTWSWSRPERLSGTTVPLPQQTGLLPVEVMLRNPGDLPPPLLLLGTIRQMTVVQNARTILVSIMFTVLLTGAAMMLLNYLLQGREMSVLALWLAYMLLLVSQIDMLLPQSHASNIIHQTAMLLLGAALCCSASLRLDGSREAWLLLLLLVADIGLAIAWLFGSWLFQTAPLLWLAQPMQIVGFGLAACFAFYGLLRSGSRGRNIDRMMDIALLLQLVGLGADLMLDRSRMLVLSPVLVFSCAMAIVHLCLAALKQARDRANSEALERQLEQRVAARTEELRFANEQLSRIDASRGEFFSHIAHDLQSPLTIIRGSLDLITDGTPVTDEERENYLVMAKASAVKLTNRIKALRGLALMEETEFSPKMHKLQPLIAEYVESWRGLYANNKLKFVVSGNAEEMAMLDPPWLQNALERLVSNAVRYTPPGGTITVAWERENFGVQLSVKDTGCGIAESDMPALFNKFYEGWNSQEGLGIGLAVVQRVAQRHGGRVWAESSPGHGATFTIFFPDLPAYPSRGQ